MADVTLTGIKQLDRKLERLAAKDARRIARNAVRAGLRVGAKALKREVPVGKTKRLKRSIGSAFKKMRGTSVTEGKWGVNVGKRLNQIVPYAHLPLLGTEDRVQDSGRSTGRVEPNDAVARAERKSHDEVLSAITAKVKEGIAALRK